MRLFRYYPFVVVLAIEFTLTLHLAVAHRGVIGHDAFQYFYLQYCFLNNAATAGQTAQWMPLMTHGAVANWWYCVQSGILQCALMALGGANKVLLGRNFLPIYYAGILFDHCLYLVGICLLGRRYFASNLTVLFTALTALGSCLWFTQVWFDLHFVFALPLILHFVHRFLETARWRYFLLLGNLLAVQTYGTLPYLVSLSSLVVLLYVLLYALLFWNRARPELGRILSRWRCGIVPVALVGLSLYVVHGMLTLGTDQIVNYDVGRSLAGTNSSLRSFLTYGNISNLRWGELITRVSPGMNNGHYVGYLALAFAFLGFTRKWSRPLVMIGLLAAVTGLIAAASPVAALFYYTWPLMKYYRHLSLASSVVRMFVCLLAGFGFERVLLAVSDGLRAEWGDRLRWIVTALLLAEASVGLALLAHLPTMAKRVVEASIRGPEMPDMRLLDPAYLVPELSKATWWCGGATLFFVLLAWGRVPRQRLAMAAIAFQALDIYTFKYDLSMFRTVELSGAQYEVSKLQPVPYSIRRERIDYANHPRARLVPQNSFGAVYWSVDSYMLTDPPDNMGRTNYWLLPFDDFLRTYSGEKIRELDHRPKAFHVYGPFHFPSDRSSALKLAGVTEDKIQFFSDAHRIESDEVISALMASEAFGGDLLFISKSRALDEGRLWDNSIALSTNERVRRSYEVTECDANNVEISVHDAKDGEWLYYADVWHPFWHATVNGREVPVEKASLAYKAVRLSQGENHVHFQFQSKMLALCLEALNLNGLLWVGLVLCILYRRGDAARAG